MEVYILFGLGTFLSTIGFLIVRVLNGIERNISEIKDEVRAIKGYINGIEGDIHKRVTEVERRHEDRHVELDRRLSKVEARCAVVHRDEP